MLREKAIHFSPHGYTLKNKVILTALVLIIMFAFTDGKTLK